MGRLLSSVGAALGLHPSEFVTMERSQSDNKTADVTLEAGKQDCTTCKLVGSSMLVGCGAYCLVTVWRNPKHLSGTKLRNLRFVGVSMGTGFIALAACRFFNLGPFAHLNKAPTKQ